ncbi:MAG: hypothetical protein ACK54C_02145 [Betaproteobacteria bacterium]
MLGPVGLRNIERGLWIALIGVSGLFCFSLYAENAKLKLEIAERENDIIMHIAESEAKLRQQEAAAVKRVNQLEIEHAAQSQDRDRALSAALGRLRDAEARAARKPAADAPATCRDYGASPDQLSVSDREILVRLGAAADEVAGRLALCRAYVDTLRELAHTNMLDVQ